MCAEIRRRKNAKQKDFFSSRINILFNINVDSSFGSHSYIIASPKTATFGTCSYSSVSQLNIFQINNRGSYCQLRDILLCHKRGASILVFLP